MKLSYGFVLASALALALLAFTPAPVVASSCGIKPIKPIPPIGCRDLYAQCLCDSRGQYCQWEWVCVGR